MLIKKKRKKNHWVIVDPDYNSLDLIQGVFRFQKILAKNITSNVCTYVWSIKCGRKKPIAQFACKLRDESFEPNYAMI